MPVSSKAFLASQRKVLLAEIEDRLGRAAGHRSELASFIASSEAGDVRFDEEGGEADTGAVVRDQLVMMVAGHDAAAEAAQDAIARIDAGTYETCAICGEDIGRERLEAMPSTTVCVTCKTGRVGG